ncbi:unnamed protein product [Heligmosomoides polygyrus]|uniref:Uncharacterized protein n=1 Tax=Heligmosomoides polygyrus TaxID=6339 RepID=A0A183FHK2_HELPZ|nr:unnamed protein product [Heligmosomoides polygyrus]
MKSTRASKLLSYPTYPDEVISAQRSKFKARESIVLSFSSTAEEVRRRRRCRRLSGRDSSLVWKKIGVFAAVRRWALSKALSELMSSFF